MLSHSGGLSSQQQAKERSRKRQAIERVYETEYRRVMKALGANIKASKGDVKTELQTLQKRCHEEREVLSKQAHVEFDAALQSLRQRRKDYLAAVRAGHREKIKKLQKERRELSDEIKGIRTTWPDIWRGATITAKTDFDRFVENARAERARNLQLARQDCLARGSSALANAKKKLETLEAEKKERLGDRRFSKQYKAAGKKIPRGVSAKQKRKERAQESDDEVRGNIPPELVPIFEMIRNRIKGNDRLSRTEAFLKAYEEDSGNLDAALVAKQEAENERELERWHRERQEVEEMRAQEASKQRREYDEEDDNSDEWAQGSDEWAKEAAAQAAFLEKQRQTEEAERKAKEKLAAKKAGRKKQTQFTSRGGAAIVEGGKQKKMLDDDYGDAYLPPGAVYDPNAEEVFGVPL